MQNDGKGQITLPAPKKMSYPTGSMPTLVDGQVGFQQIVQNTTQVSVAYVLLIDSTYTPARPYIFLLGTYQDNRLREVVYHMQIYFFLKLLHILVLIAQAI